MTAQQRIILAAVFTGIVGFALGSLWQYTSVRDLTTRLEATQHDLDFQRLEATLGAATIEAQRGSYEIARQLASSFFGGLQQQIGAARGERQEAFHEILQHRDAMITALSRSDPQSGPMLAQLFVRYRIAMGEPVGPDPGAASAPGMAPGVAPTDSPAP
jgi:hypothetical protein